ncbi:YicC/YloC family endoribonuclease [Pseudoflavonifractor sp. An85]|uniref:YicC/YloC family endoribonuclease n=1 Tax=Pseudoflavonifractor sp. An85 TaxID=1965661 RepID=UPI000B3A6B7A|nr:YicC/YloC family endoribonuclease [Pseudoflavonifractor sp. An85]OUN25207.1 YicC family protein [Pseudoflavonifractor sp. An85]
MVKSMTGYGRGECSYEGGTFTIEVRSVNNRYLDCGIKMPRSFIFAEDAMKAQVQASISRGKVDVFVTQSAVAEDDTTVVVNEALAKSYIEALEHLYNLGGGHWVKGNYYAPDLARFPDVLTVEKKEQDQEQVKAGLLGALAQALTDFDSMRVREGQRLAQDILGRVETIENLVSKVEERSPQTVAEYRVRLTAKMNEILQSTQIEESRILTEAAIFADKVAVDEETVRLRSHIAQLREMLEQGGAVGRKLDFLIQEFNREANTIGSKCNDIEIARVVVDIKAEIEKIREQVQNLE